MMKSQIQNSSFWAACLILFLPCITTAMEAKVIDKTLIMSGPVVLGDLQRFEDSLATNSQITTVVLRNSWGGHIESGYRIGERIRALGLSTLLSGYCVSSCSRMFLGGKERRFTNDFGLWQTYVGFHGHYDSSGKLNSNSVQRWGLLQWIIKHSDDKADPELVKRWINLERNTGMVAFMHPDTSIPFRSDKTFLCTGLERSRPHTCETIPFAALDMGVITDLKILRSPDQ